MPFPSISRQRVLLPRRRNWVSGEARNDGPASEGRGRGRLLREDCRPLLHLRQRPGNRGVRGRGGRTHARQVSCLKISDRSEISGKEELRTWN